jgi:hypothetical protein
VSNGYSIIMSFLGGAECSTAGNPLGQFTKHVQDDKSLQRDRLVGRGPGALQGMRSAGMSGSQDTVRFSCFGSDSVLNATEVFSRRADIILDDE